MKTIRAIGIYGAALFCSALASSAASAGPANRIVAVVNDDVITQTELDSRVRDILEDKQTRIPAELDPKELRGLVLQRLVEQRLILQEGKQLGVKVPDEEVLERLHKMKERIGSQSEYEQWLDEVNLTEGQLKQQIRDQLLVQNTIDSKVRSTISVSPQEVAQAVGVQSPQKAVERAKVSHILVRVNQENGEEAARAAIEAAKARLDAGESFADVAKAVSQDPQAEAGGSLGWISPGQLLPELDAVVFALTPGQTSAPVQTRLGFHLLRLEERRSGEELSVLEANTATFHKLYDEKFQSAMLRWLDELKERAYIEIVDEPPQES